MNSRSAFFACALAIAGCSDDDNNTATPAADSGAADAQQMDAPATDAADEVGSDGGSDTGGDAGTAADCIDASAMAAYFSLEDANKCLVARYEAPTGSLGSLTWGRHGGPLGFSGGATPTLVRYEVPGAATGALAAKKTEVPVTSVPSTVFWGSQAIDLPFFGWTAFAYTGSGMGFPGEVFLVNDKGAITRYHVNGFFAAAVVGAASGGRVLHTSTGPISAMKSTSNRGAVYAADSCGDAATPRLLGDGCSAPLEVSSWESGASGPVAADPNDNFFAILSTFGGKQELRGFERSTVARGAPATAGDTLFADESYTSDLVADGAAVYFQPNDAKAFSALDPMMLEYTVETKKVVAKGAPKPFLKMKTAGTAVSLLRDPSRRIWVGVAAPAAGDAGATTSMVFVLREKSPKP